MPAVIGGFDISSESPLGKSDVDQEALRQEIYRMYHLSPGFPVNTDTDLLYWAEHSQACQYALEKTYGRLED